MIFHGNGNASQRVVLPIQHASANYRYSFRLNCAGCDSGLNGICTGIQKRCLIEQRGTAIWIECRSNVGRIVRRTAIVHFHRITLVSGIVFRQEPIAVALFPVYYNRECTIAICNYGGDFSATKIFDPDLRFGFDATRLAADRDLAAGVRREDDYEPCRRCRRRFGIQRDLPRQAILRAGRILGDEVEQVDAFN